MARYKRDIEQFGADALHELKQRGGVGIVLAGHPYHLSPEVNHGIPELINSYGVTLFTEDSVCWMAKDIEKPGDVGAVDQWVYHSRLYRAAMAVASHPDFQDVELVQFNSFGCGLDAISTEQTADILTRAGKLYTLIKIDEGKNNGAVKIRIRSLLAAIKCAKNNPEAVSDAPHTEIARPNVTETKGRVLLCPPLSNYHFQFLGAAFENAA